MITESAGGREAGVVDRTADAPVPRSRGRTRRARTGRRAFPYLLNAPAVVVIFSLIAYPVGLSIWYSLHKYSLRRPGVFDFLGLKNYVTAVTSADFRSALWVTFEFSAGSVLVALLIGLALALILNRRIPGRRLVRALVLVPWAVPPIINATMWRLIYDAHTGALNGLLYQLGLIHRYQDWLTDPRFVVVMVILAFVWNRVPLVVIVLLASLQAVPADLYEAARVDRASKWCQFRRITLPWLTRPILIVLILETMTSLRSLELFYVLTSGGPGNSTTVVAWLSYQTSFVNLDFGLGSAYSYLIVLITAIVTVVYLRLIFARGEVH
ncbi:MAG: sugar ABC transporter permease [Micromonosporaceae bacterium]|nr:sugar ABC transporter permease [Micromonosporaceae bacterium]